MLLMFVFSVLLVREAGKQCAGRRRTHEPAVNMIQGSREERGRRHRRQEAVRRAIAKETAEGLKRRRPRSLTLALRSSRAQLKASQRLQLLDHLWTLLELQLPLRLLLARDPARHPSFLLLKQELCLRARKARLATRGHSCQLRLCLPLLESPVPEGGFRVDLPATRDVGVQTNELGGLSSLTHEQLSELQLYTTSGKRPGALHMFLECHSMRGFSNPQHRLFCRYRGI